MINIIQVIHVHPVNDTMEHDLSMPMYERHDEGVKLIIHCKCKPRLELVTHEIDTSIHALKVIHNSFDGREGLEWAKEILK